MDRWRKVINADAVAGDMFREHELTAQINADCVGELDSLVFLSIVGRIW